MLSKLLCFFGVVMVVFVAIVALFECSKRKKRVCDLEDYNDLDIIE